MEISPPETFVTFLQAIIEAEIQADLWKAKLFYFSPQQIVNFLNDNYSADNNSRKKCSSHENLITIESLVNLMQKSVKQDVTHTTTDSQKVISKYFGFSQSTICPKDHFLQRLKPTDNKLILGIQKHSLKLDHSLCGLLSCILSGYEKIKLKREECASNMHPILSYFHRQMGYYKGLSKEALKEITFEANIYGRISFSYLREYVFGHDQEIIGWETLFGVKISEGIEKIQELSEENISSEQFLKQEKSKLYTTPQITTSQCPSDLTPDSQSIFIQSVSQIKNLSQPVSQQVSETKMPANNGYTKVLTQINQIETLLNKTKERYQKNRQDLQNETHVIRSQHLKRSENIGRFSSGQKNMAKYQGLRIHEGREKIVTFVETKEEKKVNDVSKVSIWQKTSPIKKVQSPFKSLKLTHLPQQPQKILPLITRQQMRQQISSTVMDSQTTSCIDSGENTSRNRQAGKIKRRSVSKDVERGEGAQSRGQWYSENVITKTMTTNYSEYEAVLKEIKREESKFKKMVEEREKILNGRGDEKTALRMHRNSPLYEPLTGEFSTSKPINPQRDSKMFTFQNTSSNSRYSNIMREIDNSTNSLSRSRVSSKKREQIVQKATSEARLRIQEIENRALKRIAKLDIGLHDKPVSKHSSYLVIESSDTIKTEKYKSMKQNTPAMIRSQKSPHNKNLLIQDLLNERPNLKLSSTSSIYKPNY